jgi:predicted AAA+ superfamily ATPase
VNAYVFYYKNGKECDFIVQKKDEAPTVVQVCYTMLELETKNRELKSLLYVCEKLHLKRGVILTLNDRGEKNGEGINIRIIPVVKFLLGEEE